MKFLKSKTKTAHQGRFSAEDGSFPVVVEDTSLLLNYEDGADDDEGDDSSAKPMNCLLSSIKSLRCSNAKCGSLVGHGCSFEQMPDNLTQSRCRLDTVDETVERVVDETSNGWESRFSHNEIDTPIMKPEASYEDLSPPYEKARDENYFVDQHIIATKSEIESDDPLSTHIPMINNIDKQKNVNDMFVSSVVELERINPKLSPAVVHLAESIEKKQHDIQVPVGQASEPDDDDDEKKDSVDRKTECVDVTPQHMPVMQGEGGAAEKKTSGSSSENPLDRSSPSSFSSLSSFGVQGVNEVATLAPLRLPPTSREPTARPFFWRSHPQITVKSYKPQVPKTGVLNET